MLRIGNDPENGISSSINIHKGTGRIGISRDPTRYMFDVSGSFNCTNLNVNGKPFIGGGGGGSSEFILEDTNTYDFIEYIPGEAPDGTSGSSVWDVSSDSIYYTTGNVGIGTTNPLSSLHVAGSTISSLTKGIHMGLAGNIDATIELCNGGTSGQGSSLIDFTQAGIDRKGRILYSFGDDSMRFETTNGTTTTERLQITSTGNVGIGTGLPSAKLTVRKDGLNKVMQTWIGDLGTETGRTLNILSPDTDDINAPFKFSTGNAITFRIDQIEALNINSGGKVGIGTSSFSNELDISGNARMDRLIIGDDLDSTGNVSVVIKDNGTGNGHGNVTSAGGLRIVSTAPQVSGSVDLLMGVNHNSKYAFLQSTEYAIQHQNLIFQPVGGNVGIGTTSPSELLHLSGTGDVKLLIEADVGNSGEGDLPTILMTQDGSKIYHAIGGNETDNALRIECGKDDSGANFISSTECPIVFHTGGIGGYNSGSERMRIAQNGNVGIGTNSPASKLHVNGSIQLGISASIKSYNATSLTIQACGNATGEGLILKNEYTATNGSLAHLHNIKIGRFSVEGMEFNTNNITQMVINSAGNVGIGTTSPSEKLQVIGNIELGTSSESKIKNTVGNLTLEAEHAISLVMDNNGNNSTTAYVNVLNGSTELMRINANGNVGIGTNAPAALLHLKHGSITDTKTIFTTQTQLSGIHTSYFKITENKHGAGTSWTDYSLKLQRTVDVTTQGYIEFGPEDAGSGIALGTGGTELMRLTQNGNVGIGTTSPQSLFHIKPINNTNDVENMFLDFRGDFTDNNHGHLGIFVTETHTNSVGPDLRFKGSTYNNSTSPDIHQVLCLKPDGKVGIGTTSPGKTLDISSTTGTTLRLETTGAATNFTTCPIIALKTASHEANINLNSLDGALRFSVNDTNRMFLTPAGNVGIGTTSPDHLLHLYSAGSAVLRIEADYNNNNGGENELPSIYMTQDGGKHFHSFAGVAGSATSANDNSLRIENGHTDVSTTSPIGSILFATGGTNGPGSGSERMRITSDGYVGIGTTSPSSSLHVAGERDNVPNTKGIHMGMNSTNDAAIEICAGGTATSNNSYIDFSKENVDRRGRIQYRFGEDSLIFETATNSTNTTSTERMRITSAGNVGIGTDSPSQKLHVNGNAKMNGLTVGDDGTLMIESITGGVGTETVILQTSIDDITLADSDRYTYPTTSSASHRKLMCLQPYDGRVGIGTTAPLDKLDVNGSVRLGSWQDTTRFIGFTETFNTSMIAGIELESVEIDSGDQYSQNLHFRTHNHGINHGRRMTIDYNGNVGIGTTLPTHMLDTNGGIQIRGIPNNTTIGHECIRFARQDNVAIRYSTIYASATHVAFNIHNQGAPDGHYGDEDGVDYNSQIEVLRLTTDGNNKGRAIIGDFDITEVRVQFTINEAVNIPEIQVWVDNINIAASANGGTASTTMTEMSANPISLLNNDDFNNQFHTLSPHENAGKYVSIVFSSAFRLHTLQALVLYPRATHKRLAGSTIQFIGSDGSTILYKSGELNNDNDLYVIRGPNYPIASSQKALTAPSITKIYEPVASSTYWYEEISFHQLNVGVGDSEFYGNVGIRGNVGIGTTDPLSALNVQQTYALGTSNTTHFRPQLIVGGGSGGNISGIGINTGGVHNHLTCGSLYYKNNPNSNYGIVGYLGLAVTDNSTGEAFGITEGELETLTHLAISCTGYVGIGTTSPSDKLHVNGNCRATSFISTSDDRVKHNETPLTNSLELISQLHPKRYLKTREMYDASLNLIIDTSGNYTDISENDMVTEEIGIIAQEVQSIQELSFLVKPSLDVSGNETGPMGLDYQSLFVLSIKAIQEQQTMIQQQQTMIESLVQRLDAIEANQS